MLKYFISFCLLSTFAISSAQNTLPEVTADSVKKTQPYGLRVGIDLSKVALSFFKDSYTGLELVGDYRITENLYAAAEIGNEKKATSEDTYDFTTSGSYIKLGIDRNVYKNWYGMNNLIHVGGRYAFSTFSQTTSNVAAYDTNRYWSNDNYVVINETETAFNGRTASWLELVLGMKTELLPNLYLNASVRIGYLVSDSDTADFPNLWIPGFNKVTDGSRFGSSYNYSISYFIPLYKKAKKQVSTDNEK